MSSRGKGKTPLGNEGSDGMPPEKEEGIIQKAVDAVTGAVDAVIEHASALVIEKPPAPPQAEASAPTEPPEAVPVEIPPEPDGFTIIEEVDLDDEDEDDDEEGVDDSVPLPSAAYRPPHPPFDRRQPRAFPIHTNLNYAHDRLAEIMSERKANWFSAIGKNLWRRRKDHVRWLWTGAVGIVVGGVVGAITQDPVTAVAAGTAAAGTAPPAVDLLRIRRVQRRKGYPDTPEFSDDWAVTCYEFIRIIRGFNLRMVAVERLRQLAERLDDPAKKRQALDTADVMMRLLEPYWDEFVYVTEVLSEYAPPAVPLGSVLATEDANAAVRLIEPLKDGRYDWLMLDPEVIPVGKERERLEDDIIAIQSHRKSEEFADPYLELQREQERKRTAKRSPRPPDDPEDDKDD